MFRTILRMLSVVWIVLIAASAVAQDKGFKIKDRYQSLSGGNKWAVIIGINDYLNTDITDLRYAVNDAEKLHQLLIDPEYGGFKPNQVKLITDKTQIIPNRVDILKALKTLENSAGADDTIFIFFSGHGIEEDGESYFLARDTDPDIVADTAVSKSAFERTMSRTQARIQVMFFDACHSGARKDKSAGGKMGQDLAAFIEAKTEGRVILSSCGLDEVAYEDETSENGVFTRYLLESLQGMGDENGDGVVSATEASRYTTEGVQGWAFNNNKNQNPRMSANVSGQIILTVNREGERLAKIQAQRQQVESELTEVQSQLRQARRSNDSVSEAAAKQQAAELAEKVRQAKLAEESERIREEEAAKQRAEEALQRDLQTIRDAESRKQARQEQAEIERKRQQLEADRQRLQAQQVESMTLNQALAKAKEIQRQINGVRPQVRSEIRAQIAKIPKLQKTVVLPKDEFEKRATYQKRLNQAKGKDQAAQQRYNQEVSRIEGTLTEEVKARSEGYKEALLLLNRDLVLDETQVELNLGPYDAESEFFPDARLGLKGQSIVDDYEWELYVPIVQAKQFKDSVISGTAKIRVNVNISAEEQTAVIEKAIITDLVQDLTAGFPQPSLEVTSSPSRAMVLIDGKNVGLTPFRGKISTGRHKVNLMVKGLKELPSPKTVDLSIGDQEQISFVLKLRSGDKIVAGTLIDKYAGMVLIPAGSFSMGSNDGDDDEKPMHKVYVDGFYMDKYEVTNAKYRKFMSATGHREPKYWSDSKYNQPSQPVVGASWNDAVAYARWAGKRLPTGAEWEYAARGGLSGKKYPWGDSIGSSQACYDSDRANSVGSYSANGYGLYDMAGNVWEWCADWYDSDYYALLSSRNPQGPSSGRTRVLRGGSWYNNAYYLRAAYRVDDYPSTTVSNYGFRCVSGL